MDESGRGHESKREWDYAVVGGGLAGSAAATTLAAGGHSVLLIEADTFPRDKLCGEFLSGESRRIIQRLGCLEELMRAEVPSISTMRFISRGGRELVVDLPAPALGVSRRLLDQTLFRHARSQGVETREGARVTGLEQTESGIRLRLGREEVRARRLIAAWGRRSPLEGQIQQVSSRPAVCKVPPARPTHIGLKHHHWIADNSQGREVAAALETGGELILFEGGYCGLSRVEGGRISVCALLTIGGERPDGILKTWESVSRRLCWAHPVLARRLEGLVPCEDRQLLATAVWGFSPNPKSAWSGRVLRVGDAAGMIAPLCGDGQAMALESGVLLGELLCRPGGEFPPPAAEDLARDWQRLWDRTFQRRMSLGSGLQRAAFRPALAECVIGALRLCPPLTRHLARATRGNAVKNQP